MKTRMNEHTIVSDLLPEYVAGLLDESQRRLVQIHLRACGECQADLALWQSAAGEVIALDQKVSPPPGLLGAALGRIRAEGGARGSAPTAARRAARRSPWRWLLQLLYAQAPLVRREIWPASAAVMLLGFVAALVADHALPFQTIAPLVAAACVAAIYGHEHDPGFELAIATPTSPRQILLARLVLVFGYNLGLALIASLALIPLLHTPLFSGLVLGWLAPMTFLSAAALVLSLWTGSGNAATLAYMAWLSQFIAGGYSSAQDRMQPISPLITALADIYLQFWTNTAALLVLSAVLFGVAFWLAGRQEHRLQQI